MASFPEASLGSYNYDIHVEGVRLRWTRADQGMVSTLRMSTQKSESTDDHPVFSLCKVGFIIPEFRLWTE